MQYQTYNQDGVIKGAEGITYEKEQYSELSVPLTDEYIAETILEVQRLFENPDNVGYDGNEQFLIGDAYWNDIAPREKLLNMIAKTYDKKRSLNGVPYVEYSCNSYNRYGKQHCTPHRIHETRIRALM